MSWDLFIQDLPAGANSLDDIPEDFEPGIIGRRSELIAKIREIAQSVTFDDPAWGTLDDPRGFSISFSMGECEEVDCIGLRIHGSADNSVVDLIADLLRHLGLRAIDPSSRSGVFDRELSLEGFEGWKEYLSQISQPSK